MFNNPIIVNSKNLRLYIIAWLLFATVNFIFLYFSFSISIYFAVVDSVVFSTLLGGLGLSFWFTAKYISPDSYSMLKVLSLHIATGIISSIIWLFAGIAIINYIFFPDDKYLNFFYNTLAWRGIIGSLFYYLVTSFYYVIIYYSSHQQKKVRETELKNLVTEAELKSLKFQINPHFIFNSLNSISALTSFDPDKAKEMILKLADFLRYTLSNNAKQQNKLTEELRNIKLYLEIEKIRFEDKFEYVEDICPECLEIEVPNMILQPLFENAIKHAVYETLDSVTLKLSCKKVNNNMQISLENNYESKFTSKKGAGIGLKNIDSRLELIYGQKNLLEITKDESIFKVTLNIPQK